MLDKFGERIKVLQSLKGGVCMKTRVSVFLAVVVLCAGLCTAFAVNLFAAEESSSASDAVAPEQAQKGEISSDRQQIGEEKDVMKGNAQAARQEEKNLRDKMREAYKSGDRETAKSLKEELKTTHQENVQQKKEGLGKIKEMRQELKSDIKEAHPRPLPHHRRDIDNNPPGPRGGTGTNWENRPGPAGGPGASPNRKPVGGGPRGGKK